jgi:hypothetical protein
MRMKYRRLQSVFLAGVLTLAACMLAPHTLAQSPAAPGLLVSEQEASASRAAPQLNARTARVPDAPQIDIIAPDIKGSITSPTVVQLRFKPVSPAVIKPGSFKALYGAFRIDITSRLLKVARLDGEGLTVEGAQLPSGSHRIALEIEDSAGRVGSQLLSVTVQ